MMTDRLDTSFLDDALEYVSREARHNIADTLACHLHNAGYALEGNTEESDLEWFARRMYEHRDPGSWERAPQERRGEYREIARNVLAVLPDFQLRMAHRLIALSKVVRDIERAERAERKKLTGVPR